MGWPNPVLLDWIVLGADPSRPSFHEQTEAQSSQFAREETAGSTNVLGHCGVICLEPSQFQHGHGDTWHGGNP